MVSITLAMELKEGGLNWTPGIGDWFATKLPPTWWLKGKKSGQKALYLLTGQPTENGYYGWSIIDTEPFCELFTHDGLRQDENWEYLNQNFLWLPRIDQLIKELSQRTMSFHILYKAPQGKPEEKTGYWIAYTPATGDTTNDVYGHGQSLEDALGYTLLSILIKKTMQNKT